MLFDKPSGKATGRVKFFGTTPLGLKVSGYFFRIIKKKLQIKCGEKWYKVDKVYLSRKADHDV